MFPLLITFPVMVSTFTIDVAVVYTKSSPTRIGELGAPLPNPVPTAHWCSFPARKAPGADDNSAGGQGYSPPPVLLFLKHS